jgi:polyhydroxybutyrate depolymerase
MGNRFGISQFNEGREKLRSLLLSSIAILLGCTDAAGQQIDVVVGNESRSAIVHNAPAQKDEKRPYVIVLHGGAGNSRSLKSTSGFDSLARAEGFAVAYAEGTEWAPGRFAWNTGYLLRGRIGTSDDIAYLDRLIDKLILEHGADPDRIYMTGGSNGAMMTFIYGVVRAERLAAVATVVGAMFSFDRKPKVPLPIMVVNGKKDNEVPIDGGYSGNPVVRRGQSAPYKSMAQTIEFWKGVNRSNLPPKTIQIRDAVMTVYEGADGGAPTVSVIDGMGGHGWPGTNPMRVDNTPIQSFDGAELVWNFFRDKRRRPKD